MAPNPGLSQKELASILNQQFFYLNKGAQMYAFVSADGQYVLKLVKQKHLRFNKLEKLLYSLPFTDSPRNARLQKQKNRVLRILHSSSLAMRELTSETALLYVHLLPTDSLGLSVSLLDKVKRPYTLQLDRFEFLLQRKGESLLPSFLALNAEEKKEALDDILALLIERSKKGVREMDRHLFGNVGFLDGKPFFIDTGRFLKDPDIHDPLVYAPLLKDELAPLRTYLQENDPALSRYFEEELDRL